MEYIWCLPYSIKKIVKLIWSIDCFTSNHVWSWSKIGMLLRYWSMGSMGIPTPRDLYQDWNQILFVHSRIQQLSNYPLQQPIYYLWISFQWQPWYQNHHPRIQQRFLFCLDAQYEKRFYDQGLLQRYPRWLG